MLVGRAAQTCQRSQLSPDTAGSGAARFQLMNPEVPMIEMVMTTAIEPNETIPNFAKTAEVHHVEPAQAVGPLNGLNTPAKAIAGGWKLMCPPARQVAGGPPLTNALGLRGIAGHRNGSHRESNRT